MKRLLCNIFISYVVHLIVIITLPGKVIIEREDDLSIVKGITISLSHSSKNNQKIEVSGEQSTEIDSQDNMGSFVEEITQIRNSIQYPPDALEQGLETECEWKVLIGKNRKVDKIELIRPCKYKIFEREFLKVIGSWEFKSPAGTWMEIPIRFKIEKEIE